MKTTTFFALSAALFGLAAAVPVKRDIIVQTVTSEVVTTVEVTTTVWVDPPAYTPSPGVEPAEFFESPSPTPEEDTPTSPSSYSPAAAPAAPSTTQQPAAPSSEAPAPIVPTTTLEPVVESPAPVAPTPTPAPAPVAENPPAAPEPISESTPEPQVEQVQTPSIGGGSGQYSGDMTYYAPGSGSCGFFNGESDWIVAVSHILFDRTTPNLNPNNNPICGKRINIFYGGQTFSASIADRCAGCVKEGDLDMPQAMFNTITNGRGDGRVTTGMSWSFA